MDHLFTGMGWYSTQIDILRILTTDNNNHMYADADSDGNVGVCDVRSSFHFKYDNDDDA